MRRILSVLLILVGLGLLVYPSARQCYFDYRQRELLAAWAKAQVEASQDTSHEGFLEQAEENLEIPEDSGEDSVSDPISITDEYILKNMEGLLVISKIDLRIPVLKEATEHNLNISVAHVEGTSGPGEMGNYVIAGHHMRAYGRHFNRLHEVFKGDKVEFTGLDDVTYVYEVFEVLVVKPRDTWVLEPSGDDSLITLITCEYSQDPPMRLIVRGQLVP